MKEKFDVLLQEYLQDKSKLVDSQKNYYIQFVQELPKILYKYFPKERYLVKASIGVGQKSEIPWLCIFNRNITKSATKGIYLCFLFKSDMTGFYLVLGQGITTFENLYGKDKYNNIKKVAKYFQNLIDNKTFSKEDINLNGQNSLAKGYEEGTIISKYYKKNQYDENELLHDLMHMKNIYDDICLNLEDISYMKIVDNVIQSMNNKIQISEAQKTIEKFLDDKNKNKPLLELIDVPVPKKRSNFENITKKQIGKTDYLKKAKSNINNGLKGEDYVIEFEKNRLIKLGRKDLAKDIKWISKEDDGTGYDIISYDVDNEGNKKERYIEVKTTDGGKNTPFYISANEIAKMEQLKEQYYIYRVYCVKSQTPKVYILNYQKFKSVMKLTIENYIVELKEIED